MKRIIGYARESTVEQAVNGFNLDDQERRVIEFTSMNFSDGEYSLEIVREEGASGKSLRRPKMKQLIERAEQRDYDVFIVYCLDRLTRSVKNLYQILELFDNNNIELVSISERIDTSTPMGYFFVSMIVLIAQWELDTISSRTKRGVFEGIRQGNYTLGTVPQGYKRADDNRKKIVVDEAEAELIRYIYNQIAYHGESSYTLSQKLKKNRVHDRSWSESTVSQIIRNRIYYGTLEVTKGDIYIDDFVEGIVSKEVWDAANKALDGKPYERRNYLFRNLVFCKECNSKMLLVSTHKKKSGKVYLYYKCPECQYSVSEKKIYRQLYVELEQINRVHHYYEKLNYWYTKANREANDIRNLVADQKYYGLSEDFAYEQIQNHSIEYSNAIKEMKLILEESKRIGLADRNEQEINEMFKHCVRKIYISNEGKNINIYYNDDYEKRKKLVKACQKIN